MGPLGFGSDRTRAPEQAGAGMSDHILCTSEEGPSGDVHYVPPLVCHAYGPTTREEGERIGKKLAEARHDGQPLLTTMVLPLEAMPA
jgi:hypothetical protein